MDNPRLSQVEKILDEHLFHRKRTSAVIRYVDASGTVPIREHILFSRQELSHPRIACR